MSFEDQLRVLSVAVLLASVVPLIVPLLLSVRRQGSVARKCALVAGAFVVSWAIALVVFFVVVIPALSFEEPLAQKALADPDTWSIWSYLWVAARVVGQYWYFVGQIALPLVAAIASVPVSAAFIRRLLPFRQGVSGAA